MRIAALLFVAVLTLVGCGSEVPLPSFDPQPTFVPAPNERIIPAPSIPASISVPDIGAESTLIQTGIDTESHIETPSVDRPLQASWYYLSPRPGAVGPAIILGHVDGRGQRGIFYRLKDLTPGNHVLITGEDGTLLTFEVYEVSKFPKNAFPTDRVYGNTTTPELRLITCGGAFGNAQPGHYDDNIVAFARIKS